MEELARCAPRRGGPFSVYLVGGGTAVHCGWREASIDADLFSTQEEVFSDIQGIKERLELNVEFARPEHFVPPLPGAQDRHVFILEIGSVQFYHYDPCSQLFSKVVRGFRRDIDDAKQFISSGMVEPERLRELVNGIPEAEYARYPRLSFEGVRQAVEAFLAQLD